MVFLCSYPGCSSGSRAEKKRRTNLGLRHVTLFKVPKEDDFRQRWSSAAGQDLAENHRICELHFLDKFILREDTIRLADGTVHISPRHIFKLQKDAVPLSREQQKKKEELEKIEMEARESKLTEVEAEILAGDPQKTETGVSIKRLEDVKRFVSKSLWPQSWSWSEQKNQAIFVLVDTSRSKAKLQLIVNEDLSAIIKTPDGKVVIPFADKVTSRDILTSYFKFSQKQPMCEGCGVEDSRASECPGIVPDGDYQRTVQERRCRYCREERKKLLRSSRRRSATKNAYYERIRRSVRTMQQRYRRLLRREYESTKT